MAGDFFQNPGRKVRENSVPILGSFLDMYISVFCMEYYTSLPYARRLYSSLYPYDTVACCWTICNLKYFFLNY